MIEGNVPEFSFSVTFRLFGPVLDIDAVSTELGLQPTFSCLAGGVDRLGRAIKRSTWQYTAPVDEAAPFDRHALALWGALGASKTAITRLSQEYEADICCQFRSNLDWSDFDMSSAAVRALAAFDLPVHWSVMTLAD